MDVNSKIVADYDLRSTWNSGTMYNMKNPTNTTKLTGGELALAAEAIECSFEEEARADRRLRAFQNRPVLAA